MARKGERYSQIPTLWHLGYGYPCRVMRRRVVINPKTGRRNHRWLNCEHDVLTRASAIRWTHLERAGKAIIRRDVSLEMFMQAGIVPIPERATWAMGKQVKQA
jgi:hypothetical protein